MGSRTSAYFLSDAHLGGGCLSDPRAAERRIVRFLDRIKGDVTHLYLLGDILDYWFEYRDVVPKGHVRLFGKLAELSDSGVHIEWLSGNHDIWLFGYFREELGIETYDGTRIITLGGKKFFLNHGDTVGDRSCSFRFIQSFFRNRVCQKLYSCIHPRWTVPFALWWSRKNREKDSEPAFEAESNSLVRFSADYLATHPDISYFVYGHQHVMAETRVTSGSSSAEVVLLGEWINLFSYAHYDGERLTLQREES